MDFEWHGFEWIDCNDSDHSVISFLRKAEDADDFIVIVCNFTPVVYSGYRIGVPKAGAYREVFNSDAAEYGGSGVRNENAIDSEPIRWQERAQSLVLPLPPLATVYLRLTAAADTAGADREAKQTGRRTAKQRAAADGEALAAGSAAAVKKAPGKTAAAKKTAAKKKKAEAEAAAAVKPAARKKAAPRKPAAKKESVKPKAAAIADKAVVAKSSAARADKKAKAKSAGVEQQRGKKL